MEAGRTFGLKRMSFQDEDFKMQEPEVCRASLPTVPHPQGRRPANRTPHPLPPSQIQPVARMKLYQKRVWLTLGLRLSCPDWSWAGAAASGPLTRSLPSAGGARLPLAPLLQQQTCLALDPSSAVALSPSGRHQELRTKETVRCCGGPSSCAGMWLWPVTNATG